METGAGNIAPRIQYDKRHGITNPSWLIVHICLPKLAR